MRRPLQILPGAIGGAPSDGGTRQARCRYIRRPSCRAATSVEPGAAERVKDSSGRLAESLDERRKRLDGLLSWVVFVARVRKVDYVGYGLRRRPWIAFCQLLFLFVGGPVAAMAYKAINTLDSMIGYRDERYLYFGRTAARIDDVANYIPARISAVCIAAASAFTTGRLRPALRTCLADARKHSSPNAGFPEAAMAGALGVQLGGDAIYGGEVEHRAVLGIADRELKVEDIAVARSILRVATAIAFVSFALVRNVVARR
jgi:hypothetical protein